jgi:predicted nucleic acid-binding protein
MTSGLDTSFTIWLLTDDPPDQAARARQSLEQALQRGEKPRVTDLVIVEAYFALQTHYSVPKTEALRALRQLLESGDVEPVGYALEVMQKTPNLASAKPGFVDRLIHAEIRSQGGQLLTFEKASGRLPGTKVL